MTQEIPKVAFGGECSRSFGGCAEAVFQSLKGLEKVEQGCVSSTKENSGFSEAVIVHFNRECITLHTLIEIHLLTHKSSSNHSMREKYRSVIDAFDDPQQVVVTELLSEFQKKYNGELITKVLPFNDFEPSREEITNYYYNNPEKPFCETYINPKLKLLLQQFRRFVDHDKVGHLNN